MNKKGTSKISRDNFKKDFQPKFLVYWKFSIFIFIAILYGQVVNYDFVYLDDDKIILDNYDKISSLSYIPTSFVTEYGFDQGSPYYRPIVITSFIIDAQISGRNPSFYHISNLIFHYLTSCFLFLLLIELNISRNVSFFLTLIFVSHPLLSNAIVWVAGRNDLLATLFSILSTLFFIRNCKIPTQKKFLLHITFYCLAIFSKEVAIVLPVLFLTYLFFWERKSLKWNYLLKFLIIWFCFIGIFQIIKSNVVNDQGNITYGISALIKNIQVIPEIMFKIFTPINIPVLPTFTLPNTVFGGILILLIITIPLVYKSLNKKKYYFGVLWFLIFILPGLFIFYADQSDKFDYLDTRVYLPFIGILIVLGIIADTRLINISGGKKWYAGFLIILILSGLSFFQTKKYENAITFAESAIFSNNQRPFFYHKLADYYFETGDYKNASKYLEHAISLMPEKLLYYKNLSLAYFKIKEFDKAINTIHRAIKIVPNDKELIRALVLIYYGKGDKQNALIYADKYILSGGKIDEEFYNELKQHQ